MGPFDVNRRHAQMLLRAPARPESIAQERSLHAHDCAADTARAWNGRSLQAFRRRKRRRVLSSHPNGCAQAPTVEFPNGEERTSLRSHVRRVEKPRQRRSAPPSLPASA
jgi:hypothetical protein